jgi:LysM repeat protein
MNNPEWIIVHVTATPPSMDIGAKEVNRMHRKRGWRKTGYHEIIRRDGTRENALGGFITRRLDEAGAHVGGCGVIWNQKTIGISMVGGVDAQGKPENNMTPAQFKSLREAVEEYQLMFNISYRKVIGHRDLIKMTNAAPKACPCFSVQDWLQGKGTFGGAFKHHGMVDKADPMHVPAKVTVQENETLWGLSRKWGTSVSAIMLLNKMTSPDIQTGQKLRLI